MSDSAIGPAIDYFLTAVNAITGRTLREQMIVDVGDDEFTLIESWNVSSDGTAITVGAVNPVDPEAASGVRNYVQLGNGLQKVNETFQIYINIVVFLGGSEQKPSRDRALKFYNSLVKYVSQDLTLGGILHDGRNATIGDMVMLANPQGLIDADRGRKTEIAVPIVCNNHYRPF